MSTKHERKRKLKDLRVDKISFVGRAANQRKFLLLKSRSSDLDLDANSTAQHITTNNDNSQSMSNFEFLDKNVTRKEDSKLNKELMQKVVALFKQHGDGNKVIAALKAEETEVTDEVKALIETLSTLQPPAQQSDVEGIAALRKSYETLQKQNAALQERIEKDDLRKWVVDTCASIPELDIEDTVQQLYDLRTMPDVQAAVKKSYMQAKEAIEKARTFDELGSSRDDERTGEFQALKSLEAVKKKAAESGEVVKAEDLIKAIRQIPRSEYERYRQESYARSGGNF